MRWHQRTQSRGRPRRAKKKVLRRIMSFLWLVEGESDDYESVKVAMDSKIDG